MNLVRSLPIAGILTASLVMGAPTQGFTQTKPQPPENTAELIGILPEVNELKKTTADRWKILWLHQHISEQVMAVSLQVDATIAQIDNEIARANELHSYLADRRDRTVSRANLLGVIVGGTVGATSSGLGLSSNLTKPAAAVGIGAGTLSAGLALAGIHAQKGESSQFEFPSNMLAKFFDRPTLSNSEYPGEIWRFLNEAAPAGPDNLSRKQELIQTWIRVKRIDSLTSTEKIDHLTSQPSEGLKLSIDDLEDRAAMLQDVRARIAYLKRDLGALLKSLPPVADGP